MKTVSNQCCVKILNGEFYTIKNSYFFFLLPYSVEKDVIARSRYIIWWFIKGNAPLVTYYALFCQLTFSDVIQCYLNIDNRIIIRATKYYCSCVFCSNLLLVAESEVIPGDFYFQQKQYLLSQ